MRRRAPSIPFENPRELFLGGGNLLWTDVVVDLAAGRGGAGVPGTQLFRRGSGAASRFSFRVLAWASFSAASVRRFRSAGSKPPFSRKR
jgi:hypothetical protein